MGDLIHFSCWQAILMEYKDSDAVPTISALAKEMGITYSHAVNVIKKLADIGLIKTEKNGRTNAVLITVEGKKVGQMLALCKRILKEGGSTC